MNYSRRKLNPLEVIKKLYNIDTPDFITYDASLVKGQYQIIRTMRHDGTLCFENMLLNEVLKNLVNKISYYKPLYLGGDAPTLKSAKYTIGPLRLFTVFGRFKLPISDTMEYLGERQRAKIAVISEVEFQL